jgi:hypothetical protein
MSRDEFFRRIRLSPAEVLAREFLHSEAAHIFPDNTEYIAFREKVSRSIPNVESVAIVGSGNWRYSLNPEKGFREFGAHSDVDVAVISSSQFQSLWEEMRQNHRRYFYGLAYEDKERLRRNSENVYCGFISPDWIPKRLPSLKHQYKQALNALSDQSVRFLKVKMMFFKDLSEAIDYYARGFVRARRVIQ